MAELMNGRNKSWHLLFLHINVLIFSFTGVFSKFAANSIQAHGLFHIETALWGVLILLDCMVYAFFWQKNLKHFPVNVAYAHSAVYNIWSLLWAVLIFSETITIGNGIGTLLIISGILVVRSE